MSAYNQIVIRAACPHCGKISNIRCQTHVASSFDGVDARFCDRTYRINDTMSWFDAQHPEYKNWKQGNSKTPTHEGEETECCYAECPSCRKECYAIIHFSQRTITGFELPGKIENWPDGFYK